MIMIVCIVYNIVIIYAYSLATGEASGAASALEAALREQSCTARALGAALRERSCTVSALAAAQREERFTQCECARACTYTYNILDLRDSPNDGIYLLQRPVSELSGVR